MAPISLKKSIIDKLASDLIVRILDIDKKDANFKIAMDYVMSNFRFHRFLDVNLLEVSRSLTGLCSKFRVNAQDKKADYLEKKVEEFVNLSLLESESELKQIQTDAHYALLSFLMTLSNNPLNTEFKPNIQKKVTEEESNFDWSRYLLLGEEKLIVGVQVSSDTEQDLYDSDNEIWRLSDSEDEKEDDTSKDHMYVEISDMQKQLKLVEIEECTEENKWISDHVVPSYWDETDESMTMYKMIGQAFSKENNQMCNTWETYQTQRGRSSNKYQLLNEKVIVKETLWMLLGHEDLHVYKFENDKFYVNNEIVLTHLSKETLYNCLNTFTDIGTKVVSLKRFCETCARTYYQIPKTLQAFGYSVSKFLTGRKESLDKLEKCLKKNDESMTLFVLRARLLEDFSKINLIYEIYHNAVVKGYENYSTVTERVVFFLNVFYKYVCTLDMMGNAANEKLVSVLPMFLDICQPYLEDVEHWMTAGRLPKDEEFMIYRTHREANEESGYWYETFMVKENKSSNGVLSKLVPGFLKEVQKQILVSGKSLTLLEEFVEFTSSILSSQSIHGEFKSNLLVTLKESNQRYLEGIDKVDAVDMRNGPTEFIQDQNIDPLLRQNFKVMFHDIYQRLQVEKSPQLDREKKIDDWNVLLRDCSCRSPIDFLISKSLFPVISKRYEKACAVLLQLFKTELKFFDHLAVMKNFFLMQEAGAMYEFYTEIFGKAKKKVFWQDVSFLNIVLQDALQLIYPELMDRLTVEHTNLKVLTQNSQVFDGLSLHYKVPWPISIVLDSISEQKYNEIFKFLLKVKRAIWVLEQLRFQELVWKASNEEAKEVDGDYADKEMKVNTKKHFVLNPTHQKLKTRMFITRMKMLHVIRSFHFYLMTRIEESINKEFKIQVDSARDLDEILELHRNFLYSLRQKCFLHEKVRRTKEAFMRILNLVFDFEELWLKSVILLSVSQLGNLEKEFHRCTSFLQSFFKTLAKRGSYPHFGFLATAMKVNGQ